MQKLGHAFAFTSAAALALSACSSSGKSDSGAAGEVPTSPSVQTSQWLEFDPVKGELPEALSFRDGSAYVSLVGAGQIAKIDYPSAKRSVFAQLPVQPSNYTLGSAFDSQGNLYVAVAASDPGDPLGVGAAGVYKIKTAANGRTTAALWASAATSFKFPNGLSFDAAGNLYVTDAAEGAIYKFGPAGADGTAVPWKRDTMLIGDPEACPAVARPFPVGANGIFAETDAVWAVNTDNGSLVVVDVEGDGEAGDISTVAQDCAQLEGVDGMRPDPRSPHTAFIATNNTNHSVVTIGRDGIVTTVASGKPPFYSPADLVHVPGSQGPSIFLVVNASFEEAFAPPQAAAIPKPAIAILSLP